MYTTIENISSPRENILQKNVCLVRNKWRNVRKQLHLHRLVSDYYLFNNRFFFLILSSEKSRYAIKTLPHQKARVPAELQLAARVAIIPIICACAISGTAGDLNNPLSRLAETKAHKRCCGIRHLV